MSLEFYMMGCPPGFGTHQKATLMNIRLVIRASERIGEGYFDEEMIMGKLIVDKVSLSTISHEVFPYPGGPKSVAEEHLSVPQSVVTMNFTMTVPILLCQCI